MDFGKSFPKVGIWSAASYLYVRRFLEIVSILLQDNKHVIIYVIIPFITSWTMIYFSTNVWLLYVEWLIAGSVIFTFTSSLLVQRAGRREREPREVAVGATPRTIGARLDTLEEAIRKLSSQLAYFKQKQEPRNHTETVQSPQTPKINPSSSWCYYHLRFGKESRKCGSNLCMFTPKIFSQNKTLKNLHTSEKPTKFTYPTLK